jgi:hypothetical protein
MIGRHEDVPEAAGNVENGQTIQGQTDPPGEDNPDVAAGDEVEAEAKLRVPREEFSAEAVIDDGFRSVEALLRAELVARQGASGGYNTGVSAKRSLNVGLTEAGRKSFRDARKKSVTDYLSEVLIERLSKSP